MCRVTNASSLLIVLALGACASGVTAPAEPKFDGARAFEDIRQMVALGPRPAGSPAPQQTRDYINQFKVAPNVVETDPLAGKPKVQAAQQVAGGG